MAGRKDSVDYQGMHEIFDPSRITTYSLADRPNRVKPADLVTPPAGLRGSGK